MIESASQSTGSLLIWDTGTYTILPRKMPHHTRPALQTTDDDSDASSSGPASKRTANPHVHENDKLIEAFQTRYIRLRLNGTRLPENYTVSLHLPSTNANQPSNPDHKPRRRRKPKEPKMSSKIQAIDSETDATTHKSKDAEPGSLEIDTDDDEDVQTRAQNAYPGSTNSIGSVHQRRWYMTLDRRSSGFVKSASGPWVRGGDRGQGFEPVYVRGRDFERSVVTGRLAREVEGDEGLEGYRGRAGWVGVMT